MQLRYDNVSNQLEVNNFVYNFKSSPVCWRIAWNLNHEVSNSFKRMWESGRELEIKPLLLSYLLQLINESHWLTERATCQVRNKDKNPPTLGYIA